MLCLMLVGERNFLSSYLYPLPIQPGSGVYFFLSYLRSKTIYIFAHGFPLSKKSKASLAICQGFLEKNRADFISISSQLWILSRLYSLRVVVSPDEKIFTPTDERGFFP
jgi:hypothetical protein